MQCKSLRSRHGQHTRQTRVAGHSDNARCWLPCPAGSGKSASCVLYCGATCGRTPQLSCEGPGRLQTLLELRAAATRIRVSREVHKPRTVASARRECDPLD